MTKFQIAELVQVNQTLRKDVHRTTSTNCLKNELVTASGLKSEKLG